MDILNDIVAYELSLSLLKWTHQHNDDSNISTQRWDVKNISEKIGRKRFSKYIMPLSHILMHPQRPCVTLLSLHFSYIQITIY